MRPASTLDEISDAVNQNVDKIIDTMRRRNYPPAQLEVMDFVVRNAFLFIAKCHYEKTDRGVVDEALASAIATVIFDYLARLHGKDKLTEASEHALEILNETVDRLSAGMATTFKDGESVH